jgi:hypothetical protein
VNHTTKDASRDVLVDAGVRRLEELSEPLAFPEFDLSETPVRSLPRGVRVSR